MNRKPIEAPSMNTTLFYGAILSHQFIGDISKDRDKYRIRIIFTFKTGEKYTKHIGFRTKTEAKKAKEVLIAELACNNYWPFSYTAEEFFDFWLYHYQLQEQKIAYATYMTYRNVIYNYLLPAFGKKTKLEDITAQQLLEIFDSISYQSVRRQMSNVTNIAFQYAFQHHYIKSNPALLLQISAKKKIHLEPREVPVFSVGQIQKLLFYCKKDYPDMYVPLLLSVTLGTRISETLALHYYDIDFTSLIVYINKQLGRSTNEDIKKV